MREALWTVVGTALVALGAGFLRWRARRQRIAALTAAAGMPLDFTRLERPARKRPMAVRTQRTMRARPDQRELLLR